MDNEQRMEAEYMIRSLVQYYSRLMRYYKPTSRLHEKEHTLGKIQEYALALGDY